MTVEALLPAKMMYRFLELAVDVGGDIGQSQMLLEHIRDEFCPNFVIPNMWEYEYNKEQGQYN